MSLLGQSLIRIIVGILILMFSIDLLSQQESDSSEGIVENHIEAKKRAKENGKLFLFHRSLEYNEIEKDLRKNVFNNKALLDSLSDSYVLFPYDKYFPFFNEFDVYTLENFPSSIITDSLDRMVCRIHSYENRKEFLSKLNNCSRQKPLYEYYDIHYDDEANESHLMSLMNVLLEQGSFDSRIFKKYLDAFPVVNDTTFLIFTSRYVWEEKYLELFKNLYFEFVEKGYDENKLMNRLIRIFYKDSRKKVDSGRLDLLKVKNDRKARQKRAFRKVRKFLNESKKFTDSLTVLMNYRNSKYSLSTEPNQEILEDLLNCSLALFDYNIFKALGDKKAFEMTFDFCLHVEEKNKMQKLLNILSNNDQYTKRYEYVELLAMCYYRLDNEKKAAELLGKANELAVQQKVKFKPVLPKLKNEGTITKIQ